MRDNSVSYSAGSISGIAGPIGQYIGERLTKKFGLMCPLDVGSNPTQHTMEQTIADDKVWEHMDLLAYNFIEKDQIVCLLIDLNDEFGWSFSQIARKLEKKGY